MKTLEELKARYPYRRRVDTNITEGFNGYGRRETTSVKYGVLCHQCPICQMLDYDRQCACDSADYNRVVVWIFLGIGETEGEAENDIVKMAFPRIEQQDR